LQVLVGAWHLSPTMAVFAGLGIIVGVAYTLRALQKAFFTEGSDAEKADHSTATDHTEAHAIEAISTPERIGAVVLVGASLLIGLYPRLLLDPIEKSFGSQLFDGLRKAGGF